MKKHFAVVVVLSGFAGCIIVWIAGAVTKSEKMQGAGFLLFTLTTAFAAISMVVRGLVSGETNAKFGPIYRLQQDPGIFFTLMFLYAIMACFFLTISAVMIGLLLA